MNPLPSIEDTNRLEFPVVLGVYGMLLAFCIRQTQTISEVHTLLLRATAKGHNFIALDNQDRPIGFVVWATLPSHKIESIRQQGYSSEKERLSLLDASCDKGEPIILAMLSPFGKHLDVIKSWQHTLRFDNQTCWALADIGYPNIRRLA